MENKEMDMTELTYLGSVLFLKVRFLYVGFL